MQTNRVITHSSPSTWERRRTRWERAAGKETQREHGGYNRNSWINVAHIIDARCHKHNTILHLDVRRPPLSQLLQKYHKLQIRDYFNSVFTRQAHLWQISLSLFFWTGFSLYHIYFSRYLFFYWLKLPGKQKQFTTTIAMRVVAWLTAQYVCLAGTLFTTLNWKQE